MNERMRIRDLAKETMEYAQSDEMQRRRKLWTNHNSLEFAYPPVYIRAIPFHEFIDKNEIKCQTPTLRSLEINFLMNRYRMKLYDDTIIEPWVVVRAHLKSSPLGVYGMPAHLSDKVPGGAAKFMPSILKEEDIEKLHVMDYEVDEKVTKERFDHLNDLIGDIMPVEVDRQGILSSMWVNDISTILAQLRGLEQIMWDVYDRPAWLHRLLSFMQSKILMHMEQTESANGFKLINHQNQAMPYARELQPPAAGKGSVSAKQLWGYMAAQEFTTFGPTLFKEFMFDYQKPILERYGLVAYGCCEDLTYKIDIIKSLKNLRRIAVSPFADVKKCAEQIGNHYVLSWRPNPSTAVSFGVDEDYVRKELREAFDIFDANKCVFDITLKDVETVSGDENAIVKWTRIVREEIERRYK